MDHDPRDFPRREAGARGHVADEHRPFAPARPVAEMSEEEFDAWLVSLPPPPDLDLTAEEEEAELARAEEDIVQGRVYPHSVVSAWLETWGSADYKPFKEWLKSSG